MTAHASTAFRRSRALRGIAAVVVALGYIAALGATSIGHGWQLLPHVVLEHGHPVLEAPVVLEDVTVGPTVLTTLRAPTHSHGGHSHSHDDNARGLEAERDRDVFPTSRPEQVTTNVLEDAHEHDGVRHTHHSPPEPTVFLTVSLDKHQRPPTFTVAAFSAPRLSDLEDGAEHLESIDLSVETPPPIQRG